ncbi:hypothetical protein SISNIDRAFT_481789 [Sistotremastrum niveocremeum HHB9708]|uniref:Enoyl reductase (ER) domain-containing protein n=1 Tax=Sistotremastrum niveocremeum HHB9708 TaxID=1314777 RepID=A0A164ZPC7_9AGAM|nr:hypothetical protein SISNIDRAFT_481789 [Sistotremastrum niveocremeum HHB9708]
MAKPTLIQSLLARPSQKYAAAANAQHRNYYSAKNEFLAAAYHAQAQNTLARPQSSVDIDLDDDDSNSDDDVFYTPDTSPRASADVSDFQFAIVEAGLDATVPKTLRDPATAASSSSNPSSSSSTSSLIPFPQPSKQQISPPSSRPTSSAASDDDNDTLFSWSSIKSSSTDITVPTSEPESTTRKRRTPKPRVREPVPEWAKDVRWLVPPSSFTSTPSHSSRSSSSRRSVDESSEMLYPVVPSRPRRRARSARSAPVASSSESKRMSAVIEEEEDEEAPLPNHHIRSASVPVFPAKRRAGSVLSASSANLARVANIPAPLPQFTEPSATGYSSLVLPRASYTPNKHPERVSSSVDLSRSGLAQTTMSTISITKNAAAGLASRFSFSRTSLTPAHLDTHSSPLSFASHTPPPTRVHGNQVLVQVWAVGLDRRDSLMLRERASKEHVGYIPGRSFVGRVVEFGFDVNNTSKGEWVYGLLDARKGGALAEFIVVDRRRLHRSPRPSAQMSIEKLAVLPLAGIPTVRLMRTFSYLPRGSRILVLRAHEGVGALATQRLTAQGMQVTAHIPSDSQALRDIAEANGAVEFLSGDEQAAISSLADSEFDGVLDTIGGRSLFEACRRVLREGGHFTTLVGESETAVPTLNAQLKSNMRSLRRAFSTSKKGQKTLRYAWISPTADVDDEGEDIRDSLDGVTQMTESSQWNPVVDRVVPFEKAPEAFMRFDKDENCGSVVVRLIE